MRETRLSGSEGGGTESIGSPYPYHWGDAVGERRQSFERTHRPRLVAGNRRRRWDWGRPLAVTEAGKQGPAPCEVLAVTRKHVRVPNQSASVDSPFATSLSWWRVPT